MANAVHVLNLDRIESYVNKVDSWIKPQRGRDKDSTLQSVIFAGIKIIPSVGLGIGFWKSLSRDQALLKETKGFFKELIAELHFYGGRGNRNQYFADMLNLTCSAKTILESKVRKKSNYLNATILAGAGGLSLLVGVTATIPLLTISSAFLLIAAGVYAGGNLVWFWDASDVLKADYETVSDAIHSIRFLIAENRTA